MQSKARHSFLEKISTHGSSKQNDAEIVTGRKEAVEAWEMEEQQG